MPVGEMLRRMDSAELTEWMAYYDLLRVGVETSPAEDDPEELSRKLKQVLFKKVG